MTEIIKIDINKKGTSLVSVLQKRCASRAHGHSFAPPLSRSKAGGASVLAVRKSVGSLDSANSSDAHPETHLIIPTTQSV